jgi:hypothetical protein
VKGGAFTEISRCSVVELEAIERAIRGVNQYVMLCGILPWTKRGSGLVKRLRSIRGLNVTEDRRRDGMHVTIAGSIDQDGFAKVITACQNQTPRSVYQPSAVAGRKQGSNG